MHLAPAFLPLFKWYGLINKNMHSEGRIASFVGGARGKGQVFGGRRSLPHQSRIMEASEDICYQAEDEEEDGNNNNPSGEVEVGVGEEEVLMQEIADFVEEKRAEEEEREKEGIKEV